MKIQWISSLSAIVLMMAAPASAQEPRVELAPAFRHAETVAGPPGSEPVLLAAPFDVLATEPLDMGEAITDLPYSAEMTTEVVQMLADGNRIERRSTSSVARDSRGRVRREQQIAAIGAFVPSENVRIVTISDPAAGVHYSLDESRKVALRARPIVAMRVEPASAPGAGGGAGVLLAPHAAAAADVRTESLGTKEISGVRVEGTRTVMTVPAGAVGNRKAIEVVTQRWYSPELRVVVLSTRSDPRFGETTYRLTKIRRAEPPADLFRVPADYRIEEIEPILEGPPLR